jgi:hypothetical protein
MLTELAVPRRMCSRGHRQLAMDACLNNFSLKSLSFHSNSLAVAKLSCVRIRMILVVATVP